jgi:hypothetical protein
MLRSIMRSVPVLAVFLLLAQFSPGGFAQSGIITTYVGPSQPVDGALATTQAIDEPGAVASDGSGGFYVASRIQDAVYRIMADGRLRVVTRGGTPASGDETLLSSTQLYASQGLAVDTEGNLFIADNRNNLVRKVTPTGLISVVAGNGARGFSGDGGRATAARLFNPTGVVADAGGNLFIVDNGNNRIRKVTRAGIISTVAGTGISGFDGDGGPATAARLNDPYGIALDGAGMIFIVDRGNNRIRKVTPAGMISTAAGNGTWGFSGDGGPSRSPRGAGGRSGRQPHLLPTR